MTDNQSTIAEAFSRTAGRYDAFAEDHPHLSRMRRKVYTHLERYLKHGAHILELNAGSGVDAIYLAQHGYFLHSTDIAPGMLARFRDKVDSLGMKDRVTIQECSFTDLSQVKAGPFDAVFSNMGGLNCIQDLSLVIKSLPRLLHPGAVVTWVLMPKVCLWEMAEIFRGHPRLAFRRFSNSGTRSHLEGFYFPVYYFPPRQVLRWFGDEYKFEKLEGLSVITPTAESKNFAKRFPHIYQALAWLDDRLAPRVPWSGWGDFYILSLRYQPKQN